MHRVIPFVVLLSILVACSTGTQQVVVTPTPEPTATQPPTPEPCLVQSEVYLSEAGELLEEWDDATQLASSTPRNSLSPVISELQDIRRNVEDLEPPDCATTIQTAMLNGMESMIDGYLSFLADAPERKVEEQFKTAVKYIAEAQQRLEWLRAGENVAQRLPTPIPEPVVIADGSILVLPATLTIVAYEGAPTVEVRESAGGTRRDCTIANGVEVEAIESAMGGNGVPYVRVEGSDCDGWVRNDRLMER